MTSDNTPKRLSENDARVFDELAEHGFDASRSDAFQGEDRERADAICSLLHVLDDYPVEDASEDLVAATLTRVRRAEDEREERMNIQTAQANSEQLSGRRWHFPDLFATAAMLLIAVGVIWPIANSFRQNRMVALDSSNLTENGTTMASYANANNGTTPMEAAASILPDPFNWMHSDHTGKYNNAIRNECAEYGNQDDFYRPEASQQSDPYSFQVWTPNTGQLMAEGRPVASNTNPLPSLNTGNPIHVDEATRTTLSHDGLGQNILYGDGSVAMTDNVIINGDRIWDPGADASSIIIRIIEGGDYGEDVIFLIH